MDKVEDFDTVVEQEFRATCRCTKGSDFNLSLMDALHQNMVLASQIEFMGQTKEISGLMEIEMNKYHSCSGFQGADEEERRA